MRASEKIDLLLDFLCNELQHAPGLCIPISGGSDGALVVWLCNYVFPEKTVGLHLGYNIRAAEWFGKHCNLVLKPLPKIDVDPEALRWAMVQSYCLEESCWPIGSRNRTEQVLGTYSRPSLIATVLPIINLWKSEVIELCDHTDIPKEIIESSRNPDPQCGRPLELSNIGIEKLDYFLQCKIGQVDISKQITLLPEEAAYLEFLYTNNLFKRVLPKLGPELS